jgi:hypothetical protein
MKTTHLSMQHQFVLGGRKKHEKQKEKRTQKQEKEKKKFFSVSFVKESRKGNLFFEELKWEKCEKAQNEKHR